MQYGLLEFADWVTYNQGECIHNDYILKISIIFTAVNNGQNWSAIHIPINPIRKQSCITKTGAIMICDTDGWIKTITPLPLSSHPLDTIILLK